MNATFAPSRSVNVDELDAPECRCGTVIPASAYYGSGLCDECADAEADVQSLLAYVEARRDLHPADALLDACDAACRAAGSFDAWLPLYSAARRMCRAEKTIGGADARTDVEQRGVDVPPPRRLQARLLSGSVEEVAMSARVLQFTTTPVDGKLPPSRTKQILAFLHRWEGELSVKLGPPKRSPAQNRFYWGFRIRPITEAMIHAGLMVEVFKPQGGRVTAMPTDEYVHHVFKCRYLGTEIVGLGDDQYLMPRSTTDLSVDEFWEYVTAIETDPMVYDLMAEGLHLPSPGEAGFDRPFRSGRIYEWGEAA